MNKSVEQISLLIDLLMDFDANENQEQDKQCELHNLILDMINNLNIYGDVRDIILNLNKEITIDKCFGTRINQDVKFGIIAANLCDYLPTE